MSIVILSIIILIIKCIIWLILFKKKKTNTCGVILCTRKNEVIKIITILTGNLINWA